MHQVGSRANVAMPAPLPNPDDGPGLMPVRSRLQRHGEGEEMTVCDLEKLVRLLDEELNLDEKLEVFDHLDRCKACREAIHLISRNRDKALFVYKPLFLRRTPAA
jgi:hypothetical protein